MCPDGQSGDAADSFASWGDAPAVAAQRTPAQRDELFEKLLGVSRAHLESQGIDPDEYARLHISDAMKDPAKRALVLPRDRVLKGIWLGQGGRAYTFMFATLGALAVAALDHSGPVHVLAIVVATVLCVCAIGFIARMLITRRAWLQALQRTRPPS